MNPNSQSANSSDTYPHRLAEVVGTVIAIITLILPVFVIAHYSSSNVVETHRSKDVGILNTLQP